MISNLSPQSQQFLADVAFAQQRIAGANQQLSSGLKIQAASDGPDVVSELLQLRANLQKNSQLTDNLGLAKTDADVADASLSSATQLMDTALSLAAQGATATTTAAGRQAIAGQVQGILEEMVGYANTQSGGRYVFGGDAETSPPYQLDLSQANGVDQLTTAAATRRIEDPAGGSFPASQTAQQIFDNRNPDGSLANYNVFAAVNTLRVALLNNNAGGITAAATSLKAASDHLNVSLAFYGTVENRIQNAATWAASYTLQLQTQISQLQDADVAAASLELTQGTTQLQAAFASEAKLPRYTLFDFLNTTAG
jgi:flagellar hook-associated protein 3 FlgL